MTVFGMRQSGRRAVRALTLGLAMLAPTIFGAMAQDDGEVAPELQCLRYIQAQERAFTIPAGLLTAISLVESGRRGDDGKVQSWPWTINAGGKGMFFASKQEAIAETRKLMDEGQRSIDVGCMQINLRYHPNAFKNLEEAFDPAANVAYGAQFLKSLHTLQGSWPNAVERFHSSEDGRRAEYRERVLTVWNDDARKLVMNTVMAENTDTPYHRALRDFVDGKYAAALSKYQDIVDRAPKDRLGLLGLAMTFERLGRMVDAHYCYARYLAVEPSAESVAAHILQAALQQPTPEAKRILAAYVSMGVRRPDLLATYSDVLVRLGENESALTYAAAAAEGEPSVAMYQLNAGVLSDRLNHKAEAVAYYQHFLELFARNPVYIDTSVAGVRDRARHLSSTL